VQALDPRVELGIPTEFDIEQHHIWAVPRPPARHCRRCGVSPGMEAGGVRDRNAMSAHCSCDVCMTWPWTRRGRQEEHEKWREGHRADMTRLTQLVEEKELAAQVCSPRSPPCPAPHVSVVPTPPPQCPPRRPAARREGAALRPVAQPGDARRRAQRGDGDMRVVSPTEMEALQLQRLAEGDAVCLRPTGGPSAGEPRALASVGRARGGGGGLNSCLDRYG
jgi:hypothetical protein